MATLVYRTGDHRRIKKSLSVDEQIIQKYLALGMTYRQAHREYQWFLLRIKTKQILN
jgi:ABC-type iron transport system FetAB permease component